jgi:SAM-dependent methyltransferase
MSTTSRDFFERMYRTTADPWCFASNAYEQQRYSTILDFVPPSRFRNVFEPGCSIGELTVRLAERCQFVTAIDIAEAAVESARRRCQECNNVDVHRGSLPHDIPEDHFDLIVLSEIGYYFEESELIELGSTLASRLEHGGELLAVHWIGDSSDHVLTGERVHDLLREHLPIDHVHHELHPSNDRDGFVIDRWRNGPSTDRAGR